MPTVRLIIGDVRDVMSRMIADGDTYDLLVTSPPFLALRSYLPADHPDKAREIGSEPTPATFLDTLYGLTADWGRLLPEWASICVELGDTMSGSGGGGGDYLPGGFRDGQPGFDGSASLTKHERRPGRNAWEAAHPIQGEGDRSRGGGGPGWPLAKSMCILPHAYTLGLAYGMNPLTGAPSPAGQWRIRNVITWARPNPPVGSLGKRNPAKRTGDYKFRPACSYITVACRGTGRYFDLDAVRTESVPHAVRPVSPKHLAEQPGQLKKLTIHAASSDGFMRNNPAGAPPLDWHRDGINGDGLFTLEQHQPPSNRRRTIIRRNDPRRPLLSYITVACRGTGRYFDLDAVRTEYAENTLRECSSNNDTGTKGAFGGKGWSANQPKQRRLTHAGAPPLDWHTDRLDGDWLWKLATAPYPGAHYATYPLTLPRRLILAMCPESVCTVCEWPRERIATANYTPNGNGHKDENKGARGARHGARALADLGEHAQHMEHGRATKNVTTLGFTDCGCLVPCKRCDTAGVVEGPEAGWYERECPDCHGRGRLDNYRPGRVLDPFAGSGTTAVAAALEGRDCTLIDLDPRNVDLIRRRLAEALHITSERGGEDANGFMFYEWTVEAPLPDQRQQVDGQLTLLEGL